jgi:MSHA pilin protein MshD
MCTSARQRGLTLIEVVIFIAVLGVGFAGMLILYNQVTRSNVDPLVRKQALAVAQSLLEEIELMPFTYCDPDDANVYTASSAAVGPNACATLAEATLGKEPGESRYDNTQRFDNVNDYDGFCMGPGCPAGADPVIKTATGDPIPQLADYRVEVSIAAVASGEFPGVPAGNGLRINVTATHVPTGTVASIFGYRFRYAPVSPKGNRRDADRDGDRHRAGRHHRRRDRFFREPAPPGGRYDGTSRVDGHGRQYVAAHRT